MDSKSFRPSTEMTTGVGLIVAGLGAQVLGLHNLFTQALAPFGVGLMLSDVAGRALQNARERVRIRRDDK